MPRSAFSRVSAGWLSLVVATLLLTGAQQADAANPRATVSVSPASITAGTAAAELRFSVKFRRQTTGRLLLTISKPWPAPSAKRAARRGRITVRRGQCAAASISRVRRRTVDIALRCKRGQTLTVIYRPGGRVAGDERVSPIGLGRITAVLRVGRRSVRLPVPRIPIVAAKVPHVGGGWGTGGGWETVRSLQLTDLENAPAFAGQTVTVIALDAAGDRVTTYNGTVRLASTDPAAELPGEVRLTAGYGRARVTLKRAGTQTVTATDSANDKIRGRRTVEIAGPSAIADEATVLEPKFSSLDLAPLDVLANDVQPGGDLRVVSVTQPRFRLLNGNVIQPGLVSVVDGGRRVIWDLDPPAGTTTADGVELQRCRHDGGGVCLLEGDMPIAYVASDGVNETIGVITLRLSVPSEIPFPFNPDASSYVFGGPGGIVPGNAPGTQIPTDTNLSIVSVSAVNPAQNTMTVVLSGPLTCGATPCATPVEFTATATAHMPAIPALLGPSPQISSTGLSLPSPLEVVPFHNPSTGFDSVQLIARGPLVELQQQRVPQSIWVGTLGAMSNVICRQPGGQVVACPTQTAIVPTMRIQDSDSNASLARGNGFGFRLMPCHSGVHIQWPVADSIAPVGTIIEYTPSC
jgi:hypothetical protein